jgi:uncharacterized membrane protein YfcA
MSAVGLALSALVGVSLGFFGGGGSILTVPLLVYVFGLEPKQAIASSLLVVGAASIAGALQHWRAGNVALRTGLSFGVAGMVGAYLGGRASAWVDGTLLLLLFAAMMVTTALAMWRGRRAPPPTAVTEHATGRLLAQGLGVGFLTGLIGAGGGFLIVPALALWAGLPMRVAVGTSLFIIVLNALTGFSAYLSHIRIDYGLVAAVGLAAIGGSLVGVRLARQVDPTSLRRAFAGFIVVMAAITRARGGDLARDGAGGAACLRSTARVRPRRSRDRSGRRSRVAPDEQRSVRDARVHGRRWDMSTHTPARGQV